MATDSTGRRIDYLRISLTDRCNLRCTYCMSEEGVELVDSSEILTYEEIERFTTVALGEGISKVRLTGGEPLVRRGVVGHVGRMAAIVGRDSLALTTNGVLLEEYAAPLARAGLSRVNVSLDTLDAEEYSRVTRGGDISRVRRGLDAALEAGLSPVKVNVVVVRGIHQDLAAFARMTLDRPLHVRFIEYMPVGGDGQGWSAGDVVTCDEILDGLRSAFSGEGLEPVAREAAPGGWGPARYYRIGGAVGTVGVISPLSHHFCESCNRLRLTADGRLRTCLFLDEEMDVKSALRGGTDDDVRAIVRAAIASKPAEAPAFAPTRRRMSQIGG